MTLPPEMKAAFDRKSPASVGAFMKDLENALAAFVVEPSMATALALRRVARESHRMGLIDKEAMDALLLAAATGETPKQPAPDGDPADLLIKFKAVTAKIEAIGKGCSAGGKPNRADILAAIKGCAALCELAATYQEMMVGLLEAMDEEDGNALES